MSSPFICFFLKISDGISQFSDFFLPRIVETNIFSICCVRESSCKFIQSYSFISFCSVSLSTFILMSSSNSFLSRNSKCFSSFHTEKYIKQKIVKLKLKMVSNKMRLRADDNSQWICEYAKSFEISFLQIHIGLQMWIYYDKGPSRDWMGISLISVQARV